MAITLNGSTITWTNYGSQGTSATGTTGYILGIGQRWQNMTSQRVLLDPYTNFTNRPIMVFIIMQASTSNACVFDVDGVTVCSTSYNGGSGSSSVQCIIPIGSTYRISNDSWPLGSWFELRG